MENPLLVFVSSVISGMEAERRAVRAAIQAIPLTRSWLFEESPASSRPLEESYLSKVRACDIFVLLLGDRVTEPVKVEVQTATGAGKPRLVFLSASAPEEVVAYAQSLGVKYATYADPAELAEKAAEAAGDEIISGYRDRYKIPRADVSSVAEFLDRLAAGQVQINIADGPIATRGGVVNTGSGIASIGSGNVFNIMQPPDPRVDAARAAEEHARCRYLERLQRQCRVLPLATLGGEETGDQDLTLDQVYIELNTTTPVPLTQEDRETLKSGKMIVRWEREEDSRPLSALEAAEKAPRLALLGDPGAGKSTFARMILAQLAGAQLGSAESPPGIPPDLFPIFVTLRDLVPQLNTVNLESLPDDRQQETLAGIVRDQVLSDLTRLEAADCSALIGDALTGGRCLLVLDGLDEVPQALRKRVRLAVAAVIAQYAPQRIIVTCRVRSYVGDAVLRGFREYTLAPFDERRIRRFVEAWYNAQKALGRLDAEQARERTNDLTTAALSDDLRELASNPMMLTTMAIVHQKEIGLPRERVRLYNLTVDVLLRRWQKRKTGEQGMVLSPALAEFLKDDLRLRATLEQLAYDAHSGGLKRGEAAELTRGRALELLEDPAFLGSAGLASEFLDYVDQRAGLLVGRGGELDRPTTYAFPHRTFQEYLAGCYLVSERDASRMARAYYRHASQADWRLAALLGAEDLYYNRRGQNALLDLAYKLCPADKPDGEQKRRAVLWSGAMAVLVGRDAIERDVDSSDGGAGYLKRLLNHLIALIAGPLPPLERADVGRILARLSDPREGVGLAPDGAPHIRWSEVIEPGPFLMGEGADEHAERSIKAPYQISVYPITNEQYDAFVRDGGYTAKRWQGCWTDAGRQWKGGRAGPEKRGGVFDLPNHPVVYVTWYEAAAFCNWLSVKLSEREDREVKIALPSEAQWERAARYPATGSGDDRVYPWLGDITPDHANYNATGIGTTTAAGIFPLGAAQCGALDMSGNVWEWCATKWREDYRAKQDDDLGGTAPRVVRGGSWASIRGSPALPSAAGTIPTPSSTMSGSAWPSPYLPDFLYFWILNAFCLAAFLGMGSGEGATPLPQQRLNAR